MLIKTGRKPRVYRGKPWLTRTSVAGEETGPFWILKRDDPYLWLGTKSGHVFTATIVNGSEFYEGDFLQPKRKRYVKSIVASPYTRTSERVLTNHGAPAAKGRAFEMSAFYHPMNPEKFVVAGFDPRQRVWVTE